MWKLLGHKVTQEKQFPNEFLGIDDFLNRIIQNFPHKETSWDTVLSPTMRIRKLLSKKNRTNRKYLPVMIVTIIHAHCVSLKNSLLF